MWETAAFCVMLLIVSSQGSSTSRRVKRILEGKIYTSIKEDTYATVSYYAVYGDLHEKPWLGTWWLTQSAIRKGRYGEIKCGGHLLTPEIVQTACHCLSYWIENRSVLGFVSRPWMDHHWEQIKVVYVGATSRFYDDIQPSMMNINPIKTLKFIAHPICGRIDLDPEPLSYDYAWIRVDPSWQNINSGISKSRVNFVPIFSMEQNKLWLQTVLEKRMVCMHIGFGYYSLYKFYTSTRLRVGWGVAASQLQCRNTTAYNIPEPYVNELMNWFCVASLDEIKGSTMYGDSGGPVACDNVMTGVVSGHLAGFYLENSRTVERWWSIHGSVVRNHWSMSLEYRKQFNEWVHDIGVTTFLELAIFAYTPFNYPYPTAQGKLFYETQPPKRFKNLSSESLQISSTWSFLVSGAAIALGFLGKLHS